MKYLEARVVYAFTPLSEKEKAHGNPAFIVFGIPTDNEMSNISKEVRVELYGEMIEAPIVVFISPVDLENNVFDIRYFTPLGVEINVCGHATVCATRAIVEKYNKTAKNQYFIFNLSQEFSENKLFPTVKIEQKEDAFFLELNDVDFEEINKDSEVHKIISSSFNNILDNKIYHSELNDFIFVCKDCRELRKTLVPIENLSKLKELHDYRSIMAVALSDMKGYDYETSVFAYWLPVPPYYKDPACGSANKEILKLLKVSNVMQEKFSSDVANLKMFYPYRYSETNIMGGIQEIEYYHKLGKSIIKSGAQIAEKVSVSLENEEISFHTIK